MSSRAGAAALEQRPPVPQPEPTHEHQEPGYAMALPVQQSTDESRDPRSALSGIESHALVLCRDLGPEGVCVSRMRAWPVCVRFDGQDWQRGVLVVDSIVDSTEARRTQVVAPLLSASFGRSSLPPPVGQAANGIPVRSSEEDTTSGTEMIGATTIAELRLRSPDVTQPVRTIELLDHIGSSDRRGYVLVDSLPASRAFRLTIADGGASGSGPPGTMLLRADGCSLVIPGTAMPAILGPV